MAAIPPSRNCRKARSNSIRFTVLFLLASVVNEVAILDQLADQGIDLLQAQWGLRTALEIAPDKLVLVHSYFEGDGTSIVDRGGTELLGQGENAQDATNANFSLLTMDRLAEGADVRTGSTGSP